MNFYQETEVNARRISKLPEPERSIETEKLRQAFHDNEVTLPAARREIQFALREDRDRQLDRRIVTLRSTRGLPTSSIEVPSGELTPFEPYDLGR